MERREVPHVLAHKKFKLNISATRRPSTYSIRPCVLKERCAFVAVYFSKAMRDCEYFPRAARQSP
jgi:hypothetical protein